MWNDLKNVAANICTIKTPYRACSDNLPDYNGFTYILPILSIVFEYEPKQLEQFLLEKGLTDYSKRIVAELLARMGCDTETKTEAYNKKVHDELSGIFSRVLDACISDYPTGNICDKYVVSHVVKAIVNAGLVELSDKIKIVYDKDMVEKQICGELNVNLSILKDLDQASMNYIETAPYPLMFLPLDLLWPNEANLDFGI